MEILMQEIITKEEVIECAKKIKRFCKAHRCKYDGCPFDDGVGCMLENSDPLNWWRLDDLFEVKKDE